jgi:hypothetical protein
MIWVTLASHQSGGNRHFKKPQSPHNPTTGLLPAIEPGRNLLLRSSGTLREHRYPHPTHPAHEGLPTRDGGPSVESSPFGSGGQCSMPRSAASAWPASMSTNRARSADERFPMAARMAARSASAVEGGELRVPNSVPRVLEIPRFLRGLCEGPCSAGEQGPEGGPSCNGTRRSRYDLRPPLPLPPPPSALLSPRCSLSNCLRLSFTRSCSSIAMTFTWI